MGWQKRRWPPLPAWTVSPAAPGAGFPGWSPCRRPSGWHPLPDRESCLVEGFPVLGRERLELRGAGRVELVALRLVVVAAQEVRHQLLGHLVQFLGDDRLHVGRKFIPGGLGDDQDERRRVVGDVGPVRRDLLQRQGVGRSGIVGRAIDHPGLQGHVHVVLRDDGRGDAYFRECVHQERAPHAQLLGTGFLQRVDRRLEDVHGPVGRQQDVRTLMPNFSNSFA